MAKPEGSGPRFLDKMLEASRASYATAQGSKVPTSAWEIVQADGHASLFLCHATKMCFKTAVGAKRHRKQKSYIAELAASGLTVDATVTGEIDQLVSVVPHSPAFMTQLNMLRARAYKAAKAAVNNSPNWESGLTLLQKSVSELKITPLKFNDGSAEQQFYTGLLELSEMLVAKLNAEDPEWSHVAAALDDLSTQLEIHWGMPVHKALFAATGVAPNKAVVADNLTNKEKSQRNRMISAINALKKKAKTASYACLANAPTWPEAVQALSESIAAGDAIPILDQSTLESRALTSLSNQSRVALDAVAADVASWPTEMKNLQTLLQNLDAVPFEMYARTPGPAAAPPVATKPVPSHPPQGQVQKPALILSHGVPLQQARVAPSMLLQGGAYGKPNANGAQLPQPAAKRLRVF